MKILGVDTATGTTSLALWEGCQELAFEAAPLERDQAARLPKLLKTILGPHLPDLILVNSGPGSFTGIRQGIAFAMGLAQGWNIPLQAFDGFTSTFATHPEEEDLLVLIDGKRKDLFARRYHNSEPSEIQSLTRAELEDILTGQTPPRVAGAGFQPFLDGIAYEEAECAFHGAQRLIKTYLTHPELATDPFPAYGREADVTLCPSPR